MAKALNPVVQKWLQCWEQGDIDNLPITDDFSHSSPFGLIKPKSRYLEIVNKNKADFLGNSLKVIDHIEEGDKACIQFEQKNKNTGLEMTVCEWYELEGDKIKAIQSFYNIGDAKIEG